MNKPIVAILYEYFYPGYKAGGPIQSLANMMQALHTVYDFKVITTAYDLKSDTAYTTVEQDQWNLVQLPGTEGTTVQVWYDSQKKPSIRKLQKVMESSNADTFFINGFYTNHFLFPLMLRKAGHFKDKHFIVSPRGMMQPGALNIKPLQKKLYLKMVKLFRLLNGVTFHATTYDEVDDVHKVFGPQISIVVAGNIPKLPWIKISSKKKESGKLELIYLSVITPKKNLKQLLKELAKCKETIGLSIYGPIKEQWYWDKCKDLIALLPTNVSVTYEGHIATNLVQETLSCYDAMVLLTKGENFGHALYESLSVGMPIITSFFTPWTNLEQQYAGWSVDIGKYNSRTVSQLIDNLALKDEKYWHPFREGALEMALSYYYGQFFSNDYKELFSPSDILEDKA